MFPSSWFWMVMENTMYYSFCFLITKNWVWKRCDGVRRKTENQGQSVGVKRLYKKMRIKYVQRRKCCFNTIHSHSGICLNRTLAVCQEVLEKIKGNFTRLQSMYSLCPSLSLFPTFPSLLYSFNLVKIASRQMEIKFIHSLPALLCTISITLTCHFQLTRCCCGI